MYPGCLKHSDPPDVHIRGYTAVQTTETLRGSGQCGIQDCAAGQEDMELSVCESQATCLTQEGGVVAGDSLPHQPCADGCIQSEPTLTDVLSAVSACHASLQTLTLQMGDLKGDMVHVGQDIRNLNERVKAAENRVSAVEDQLPTMSKALQSNTQAITALLQKVDDLENRSRQNNVRIVGVLENAEGRNPVALFEDWLLKVVGKDALSSFFANERAHRVPSRPLSPGAPTRHILIKLLHFRNRDSTLRAAREKKDLDINGHKVSFSPDFSTEIQKRRMQFSDIKQRLRDLHIP